MFASTVNNPCTGVGKIFSYRSYLTIPDQYITILQHTFFLIGPYRCVFDQNSFLFGSLSLFPAKWLKRISNFSNWAQFSGAGTIRLGSTCFIKTGGPGNIIAGSINTKTSPPVTAYKTTQPVIIALSFRREI